MVSNAALIATFYGPRGGMQEMVRRLAGMNIQVFDPPAAHDTTIVQVALNAAGAADQAWIAMRQQLENVLKTDTELEGIWGYTLVYQAVLAANITISDPALCELLPAAQRLQPTPSDVQQTLAHADVLGGRLWLVDIPIHSDGLKAATVYVALGPPDQENELILEVLYGLGAALLMPDLIAHKGYHQMRQYRLGSWVNRYETAVGAVRERTSRLLDTPEQERKTTEELDGLARAYDRLVSIIPDMDALRISLIQQLHNYDWWQDRANGGNVLSFHRSHLETAVRELELLVAKGQSALEVAGTTVEMVQARLDKEREGQRQRVETLLAVVAVALAVPQLIDREAASSLLYLIGVATPSGSAGTLALLGVQVGITLAVALLAGLTVKWMGAARQRQIK